MNYQQEYADNFNSVQVPSLNRILSKFDLTHQVLTDMDMGVLYPTACIEVNPGETFRIRTEGLIRMSPLVAPVMHEINVYTHWFFVPHRIVWTNYADFITGFNQTTGEKTTIVAPFIELESNESFAECSLADYLGLPTGVNGLKVTALPFRAYNKIYNDWYKNENIQSNRTRNAGNGQDSTTVLTLARRNWEKDYFTSSLPWPQRGDAVTLSLGVEADVAIDNKSFDVVLKAIQGYNTIKNYDDSNITGNQNLANDSGGTTTTRTIIGAVDEKSLKIDPNGLWKVDANGMVGKADLTDATAVSVNDLRRAEALQKWYERSARAGYRYNEYVLANFGVNTSDARLQRAEFLGGSKQTIMISDVISTAETSTKSIGDLAGYALSSTNNIPIVKSFNEHGYLMCLQSVCPRTSYSQGLHRMWTRFSYLDYLIPDFSNLGEQEVLNQEVYAGHTTATGVFGYQGRYNEFRYLPNRYCGKFRNTNDGLAYWHLGRIFDSSPGLNSDFVTCNPSNRIFQYPNEPQMQNQMIHHIEALRPLPLYPIPSLV